jgi:hypothetical protein
VFEIRASATSGNVNGGFFVTGASGTDYSQQNAAQYALTGVTSAGAGNTILTASAAADMVGNGIRTVSGTNFTNNSWFEITSVVAGVSITCSTNQAGTSICTGVGSNGVMNIGGAISLGHSTDLAVFNNALSTNPGIKFWVKSGTYNLGAVLLLADAGTAVSHHIIEGYQTTRGDRPKGSTRPKFVYGAGTTVALWNYWDMYCMDVTGEGNSACSVNIGSVIGYCKFSNPSTTAGRNALSLASHNSIAYQCEAICSKGYGILVNGSGAMVTQSYIRGSVEGIRNSSTGNPCTITDNIIEGCTTYAINSSASHTEHCIIAGNTLYGAANTTSVGINMAAGCTLHRVFNNIISGFTTGIVHATARTNFSDTNTFHNNDTDVSVWVKGATDVALNPSFTSVTQVTGSDATISGSVLTSLSASFITAGVVVGDVCYIVSGTAGPTFGNYTITGLTATTLTFDSPPGNSGVADHVYQITIGRNFSVGSALKATAAPGLFPGALTTNYRDIGAIQRNENCPAVTDVRSGVIYSNSELTGTLDLPSEANTKTGVSFDNSTKTGTYDGSDRWTDLAAVEVLSGLAYKANSTTNNRTGSLLGGGSSVWDANLTSHTTAGTFGAFVQKLLTVAKFLGLK